MSGTGFKNVDAKAAVLAGFRRDAYKKLVLK